MGLRILVGDSDSYGRAVLYCSTTERALPWMFEDQEDAEAFCETHGDIRRLPDAEQEKLFDAWVAARVEKAEREAKRRIVRR